MEQYPRGPEGGLVESQDWAELPYAEDSELVPNNEGAPVKAGDTIWLRSGYHGELDISSYYNTDFMTIAAEDGHTPEVSLVHVWSSSHWIIRGLLVSAASAPTCNPHTLVDLESHSWRRPVHDVAVEGCTVQSVADASDWSAEDWDSLACTGFSGPTRRRIGDDPSTPALWAWWTPLGFLLARRASVSARHVAGPDRGVSGASGGSRH